MKTLLIAVGVLLVLILVLGFKALIVGALCGVIGYHLGREA